MPIVIGLLFLLALAAAVGGSSGKGEQAAPVAVAVKITGRSRRDRLAGLLPEVRERFQQLQQWAAGNVGVILVPGSTARTAEEQRRLYEAGRSATPLVGYHAIGAAIDMYLADEKGNLLSWNDHERELKQIVAKANELGFRSLAYNQDGSQKLIRGRKGPIWDAGHIELRTPQTIAMVADARRAYA